MVLIQEINVPGCVDCRRFEEWWKTNSSRFPNAKLEQISAIDPKGQELISKFSIFASPGIIINNELFSTGGVDFKKLEENFIYMII